MKPNPVASPLPRIQPEDLGIPSRAISSFVEALGKTGQEIHSFILLRHGSVAAEAWWKPYAPVVPHQLYSLTKSFTSTAVGLAVGEGLLTLDDPVISFFPDNAPKRPSANLAAMRVRHLLTMSAGHARDAVDLASFYKVRDWVKAFFAAPVEHEPGTVFLYSNGASYMLSAIVQKLTGQRVADYLAPRLFEPLGIAAPTWWACPRGVNIGGFGLSLRTEDIAKFGQLLLQRGRWEDRQLLSEAWVEEATRGQVSNGDGGESDATQGYGYQFWRSRHGCYRAEGAFGQFCVVMPSQDAVLAMTGGAVNSQAILDAAWTTLLPAMDGTVRVVKKHQAGLKRTLRSLRLDPPPFAPPPENAPQMDSTTWMFDENDAGLRSVTFSMKGGKLAMAIKSKRTTTLRFGAGRWAPGRAQRGDIGGAGPVRCAWTWTASGALEATARYIATPYRDTFEFRFTPDGLTLVIRSNVSFGTLETKPMMARRA